MGGPAGVREHRQPTTSQIRSIREERTVQDHPTDQAEPGQPEDSLFRLVPGQTGYKYCTGCSRSKPLGEFLLVKNRHGVLRRKPRCRECSKEYMKKYFQKNKEVWNEARRKIQPEINARKRERYRTEEEYRQDAIKKSKEYRSKNPEKRKDNDLRNMYGLNIEQFQDIIDSQGGGCAICGRQQNREKRARSLHVDHDHHTGKIRGVLCSCCNKAIGLFRDDPELLERAAQYLKEHGDRWHFFHQTKNTTSITEIAFRT